MMRVIAVMKKCLEHERELILSSAEQEDKVLFFDSEEELLGSGELANVEILFGEPECSTIKAMKALRWMQISWAGADKYTSDRDFPDHVILTNASGAYGCLIAELVVSGLLALAKDLLLYRAQLRSGGWSKIEGDETLEGKRVLILGTGDIGLETAKKLRCFGCYIVGLCRTPGRDRMYFDEIYTIDSLDMQLRSADVVVIALPGTAETAGMFDAQRISKMKGDAILVNVGRGCIVNTQDLTDALEKGVLKGAALDVAEPEPLPKDHPLRYMENVVLTPHIAGGRWEQNKFARKRIIDIFCENLRRDSKNEPKRNMIDFSKGY